MFSGKEYVYEVYKEKSFSKAANNLYISQPSLSSTIKRIETKIGMPIFDRSITPVGLTECGLKYIQAAESIMAIEQDFRNYLDDARNLQTGTLTIGGSNLFTSYVIPPLISSLHQQYPGINVTIIEDNTSNLEAQLLLGSLDFIVDNSTLCETKFDSFLYREEHLMIAVPKKYEINQSLQEYQVSLEQIRSNACQDPKVPVVPLMEFKDYPFIMLKPNNDTMQRGTHLCKANGFKPDILFELDQQSTAYHIACSGMGICFVSDTLLCKSPALTDMIYYKLDEEKSKRNICFFSKKNRYITFAMSEFLKLIS